MKYVTLNELCKTIRDNIWKVPRDIDFIIGNPRSGMIAAGIIASFLNVPMIDVNSFVAGAKPSGGNRLMYFMSGHTPTRKVLVVDDTVSSGRSMNKVKEKLSGFTGIQFVYMCVYMEGLGIDTVDFYMEDLRAFTKNFTTIVFYEWNIMQHHEEFMERFLFDIDGVFCLEPPDERNEEEYLKYIENATPLFIPRTKIGGIITFRLLKNKEITQRWLEKVGITYDKLMMFNANSWEERMESGVTPEQYKAWNYKKNEQFMLMIESSDYQASRIAEMAGKPVYCVESNKLYQ